MVKLAQVSNAMRIRGFTLKPQREEQRAKQHCQRPLLIHNIQ